MKLPPETRYVKTPGGHVAYQAVGQGAIDLVLSFGFTSNIDVLWEYPPLVHTLQRLASFCRLILFDARGTGLSDPLPPQTKPPAEEWADDLTAVLDVLGSQRASFYAERDGGLAVMLFAAAFPKRTGALILGHAPARYLISDDYPCGERPERLEQLAQMFEAGWGTEQFARFSSPSRAGDAQFCAWAAKRQRASNTPRRTADHFRSFTKHDVRAALPAIQAPTLILHHSQYVFANIGHAHYLRDHIAGSRLVELPGGDISFLYTDSETTLALIEEFLTGSRYVVETDRQLATVLFTDIVGSTEHVARLGDARWRELLGEHQAVVRQELLRHRGREIDTAGDGFFALFDGPGRALRCALALREAARPLGIEIRAGLHIGECEIKDDKVSGMAVHIGARVMAMAGAGEVMVSSTVKDLVVGSGLQFQDRGTHTLKGVPGEWRLFAVADGNPS
jgi:class 3 adenylate cyclase